MESQQSSFISLVIKRSSTTQGGSQVGYIKKDCRPPTTTKLTTLTIFFHIRVVTTSKLTIFFHPLVVTTSSQYLV